MRDNREKRARERGGRLNTPFPVTRSCARRSCAVNCVGRAGRTHRSGGVGVFYDSHIEYLSLFMCKKISSQKKTLSNIQTNEKSLKNNQNGAKDVGLSLFLFTCRRTAVRAYPSRGGRRTLLIKNTPERGCERVHMTRS